MTGLEHPDRQFRVELRHVAAKSCRLVWPGIAIPQSLLVCADDVIQ